MSAFTSIAADVLEDYLEAEPDAATFLGDHRRDDRLPDPSRTADRISRLERQLADLARVEPDNADEQVDLEVLRTALTFERFGLHDIAEPTWNPMLTNPGRALNSLLSRDFAPLAERLESLRGRVAAIPDYLARARDQFGALSRVHVETAIAQFGGTATLLAAVARHGEAEGVPIDIDEAVEAVHAHVAWLTEAAPSARADHRLGSEAFAAKLALALDTEFDPDALLRRAEGDLARIEARIDQVSGGAVRARLDELARDQPDDQSILGLCRESLVEATTFVRAAELVTVYDDPTDIIEMPDVDRGIAVAYCLPKGPLEQADLPTQYAVSPTPSDWSAERVASFYREYNRHMVHNLTVHEAMPGHALQMTHSIRHRGANQVRSVWWSGSFVEGWAVYAEELMVKHGYRADVAPALELQQLKMQLRMIINTILDIRYHCDGLGEAEALALMMDRGYQEEGEAVGKWRRVQLTSTQLCTYYVGYCEVRDLVADLVRRESHRPIKAWHDDLLSHGSPPVRHLRTLLGA